MGGGGGRELPELMGSRLLLFDPVKGHEPCKFSDLGWPLKPSEKYS